MSGDNSGSGIAALLGGAFLVYVIIMLALVVFAVIIYWKIFSKAGYSGAMGLLMFVPIANIIVLCILAFGEWPIYRELKYLREQVVLGDQYSPFRQEFPSSP